MNSTIGTLDDSLKRSYIPAWPSKKNVSIGTVMAAFCLLDALFLPYIEILSVAASMPVVVLWHFIHIKSLVLKKDYLLFLLFATFCLVALFIAYCIYPDYVNQRNTTMTGLVVFLFLYYFCFLELFKSSRLLLFKVIEVYLLFSAGLALLFYYDTHLYFIARSFWGMGGQVIVHEGFSSIVRFTGIISDPNNASVAYVSLYSLWRLFAPRKSALKRFVMLFAVVATVVATMSTTGYLALTIVLLALAARIIKKISLNRLVVFYFAVPFAVVGLIFITSVVSLNVVDVSAERVTHKVERLTHGKSGRLDNWTKLLTLSEMLPHLVFGSGPTIIIDGNTIAPHNGHLYLFYSYGIAAYLIFMWIIFRYRRGLGLRGYITLIPIFLGFTLNVGLYGFRFPVIVAIVAAFYAAGNYRCSAGHGRRFVT